MTFIHAGFAVAVFSFLLVYLCLPFLYLYLYGGLSKYFLSNSYRIKGALAYQFVRFSLKPVIEAVIHASLYEHPQTQFILFCVV